MLRLLFALNIEQVFDRRAFSGIAGASRHYADMLLHQKEPSETFQQAVHRYGINGIILSSDDSRFVKEAFETRKPCVNIANHLSDQHRVPVVGTDDAAIGELIAQHYIDRGFRNFAFYANLRLNYFVPRQQAFVKAIENAGYQCAIGPNALKRSAKNLKKQTYDQSEWVEHAGRWLASLPKPLGLMAPHDSYARDAVQVCHVAGIRVPDQVSVIGVDNDDLTCVSVSPQISSIDTHAARVGSEAVELIRSMVLMKTRPPEQPILIAPGDIVVRGSSSDSAVEDKEIVAAVQYIRAHIAQHVAVEDVVDHVLISRRSLERRFMRALSRSVMDEIRTSRLEQAKKLLARTDYSLEEIARRSGLLRQQRLSSVIRDATGLTPAEYRKSFRINFEISNPPL